MSTELDDEGGFAPAPSGAGVLADFPLADRIAPLPVPPVPVPLSDDPERDEAIGFVLAYLALPKGSARNDAITAFLTNPFATATLCGVVTAHLGSQTDDERRKRICADTLGEVGRKLTRGVRYEHRSTREFKNWWYGLCRNTLHELFAKETTYLNHDKHFLEHARSGRLPVKESVMPSDETDEPTLPPWEVVLDTINNELVEPLRTVLLDYFQGRQGKDTAARFGRSPAWVVIQKKRAIQELREVLRRKGFAIPEGEPEE